MEMAQEKNAQKKKKEETSQGEGEVNRKSLKLISTKK